MSMLTVENINVYYGQIHAIKDVSFEVNEGEIVSLIGSNGAGKSTALKTISGLLRSRTGSIRFLDQEIGHEEAYRLVGRGLAHVPEGRRIFLAMTVEENLQMGGYTAGKATEARVQDVFARFPRLKERRNQIAGTLSGGEQQMLAMGRALISAPKLLMLDEPSMGLAPILVGQIFDIVRELHKAGTTILLVEQNAEMALKVADRAYVLESGRVTLSGTGERACQERRDQKGVPRRLGCKTKQNEKDLPIGGSFFVGDFCGFLARAAADGSWWEGWGNPS